jgi:hypothetical protein
MQATLCEIHDDISKILHNKIIDDYQTETNEEKNENAQYIM